MGFMAGKFLVAGSFGPGLALMTLNYYLLLNYLRRPDRLRALSFLAGIISGAYLNLIIGGIFLVIALAVFLLELGRKKTGAATGLLLVLLAGGVVYPYLASILGASDPQGQKLILRVPGWFQFRTLMTILLPGWIMAGITWRRTRDKNIRLIRLSAGLALFVLVSIYLFIYFPRHNEYKIPYLMSVFLAVITGINYRRIGIKTRRLVGVLILLTLPTTVLALIAYSRDDTAFSPTEPETLLYQKIRNELPEETVVIAEKNTFLAPVLGEREAYLARRDFLRSLSLDRKFINRRRALLKSLWEGNDAPGVLRKIQEEIKRPVALVTYSDRPEFQRKLERHSSSGQPTLWMGTDTGGRPPFYKKWSDYRQDEDDRSQAGNDQTEIIR